MPKPNLSNIPLTRPKAFLRTQLRGAHLKRQTLTTSILASTSLRDPVPDQPVLVQEVALAALAEDLVDQLDGVLSGDGVREAVLVRPVSRGHDGQRDEGLAAREVALDDDVDAEGVTRSKR